MEDEIRKLKVITDSEATSTQLLQALNEILLTGVEPFEVIEVLRTMELLQMTGSLKMNKQYAQCMNCDYETESMGEKDLIFKISVEGGYIQSDKDGGYFSECPSCESSNLSLMSS